jgi:NitT/TauT family transport system substrate-binding protein
MSMEHQFTSSISRRKALAGIGAALATAPGWGQAKRSGGALTKVRMGVAPRITFAPVHLADERGLFRAQGLDVEFVEFGGQVETLPALISGAVDAAMMTFTPAICNAIGRGARIRIVAGRDFLSPECADQGALYYRTERFAMGLDKSDWKGIRVALSSDSNSVLFYLSQLLETRGLTDTDVELSRMRPQDAVAAATAGRIDLFFGSGMPEYLEGGLPKTFQRSAIVTQTLGPFQISYVMFGPKLLDADPAIGASLLRAYLQGVRRFEAGEDPKFVDELAQRLHMDRRTITACRANTTPTGEIRTKDIERWMKWGVARKQAPDSVTVNQMIDLRFQPLALKGL